MGMGRPQEVRPDGRSYTLWAFAKPCKRVFLGTAVRPGHQHERFLMASRVLPYNEEAESRVVGAMMLNPKAADECLGILDPDHFYLQKYQDMFKAIASLRAQGVEPDPVSVCRELDRLHIKHTPAHVAEAMYTTTAYSNAAHWAKIVYDMWGKRELIHAFTSPMQGAWNGAAPDDVLARVEEACSTLRDKITNHGDSQTLSSFDLAMRLEERMKTPLDRSVGVGTPFGFLDRMMPGRLYVLGGYAKDGKTALSVQFLKAAAKEGKRVGFASIEMNADDLTDRVLSTYGIPYSAIQRRQIPLEITDTYQRALSEMSLMSYDVIDNPALTIPDLIRIQKVGRYDFLIIDHLHRISYEDAFNPRLQLSSNVKKLAQLARTAKIPILLLAQLHRPANSDGFPRPTMQSFKETSTIEQEASALWGIWRERDEDGNRSAFSHFLVLADRYGEDKTRKLLFRSDQVSFTEMVNR